MRVMLTGGTGFLGSYICKELLSRGHQVVVVSRSGRVGDYLPVLGVGDAVIAPIRSDFSNLDSLMKCHRPDVVVHVAAASRGNESDDGIRDYIETNVLFGSLLLNAMRANGIDALVNCGTSWQYGDDGTYSPFNFYAATKQCLEDILSHYCQDGMRAVTLRAFDTVGPHDRRNRILDLLIDATLSGSQLQMSPGAQRVHFVDVRDAAIAFAMAVARVACLPPATNEVFGIISPQPIRLADAAAVVGRVLGKRVPAEFGGRPYRSREVMEPWSGCMTLPGWVPRRSLQQTLQDMLRTKHSQRGGADGAPVLRTA